MTGQGPQRADACGQGGSHAHGDSHTENIPERAGARRWRHTQTDPRAQSVRHTDTQPPLQIQEKREDLSPQGPGMKHVSQSSHDTGHSDRLVPVWQGRSHFTTQSPMSWKPLGPGETGAVGELQPVPRDSDLPHPVLGPWLLAGLSPLELGESNVPGSPGLAGRERGSPCSTE